MAAPRAAIDEQVMAAVAADVAERHLGEALGSTLAGGEHFPAGILAGRMAIKRFKSRLNLIVALCLCFGRRYGLL
jgi:hypothetical protein